MIRIIVRAESYIGSDTKIKYRTFDVHEENFERFLKQHSGSSNYVIGVEVIEEGGATEAPESKGEKR